MLAGPATSYRIAAYAPVYVVTAPPTHVADTKANNPRLRLRRVREFLRTGDPAVPKEFGAQWLVLRRGERGARGARLYYRDRHFGSTGSYHPHGDHRVKLLLVTLYFPPTGGGGVQRPLKFATHLPALGIETHVLAPDDPKWVHADAELPLPTQAWVHRARYVGPRGRRIADELHGRAGVDLALRRASTIGRRLLVPDENVTWNATAIPKAISIARNEAIDVVLTTSPPGSVHLIGAAVKKATGVKWVADLRDSIVLHPHRATEGVGAAAKRKARAGVARLVARQADAIVAAAESIAEETRGLRPRGRVVTIANGCDFDDFAGLVYRRADRFRLTHAGSFFGVRDPKPFLQALADSRLEDVVVALRRRLPARATASSSIASSSATASS